MKKAQGLEEFARELNFQLSPEETAEGGPGLR
jgi:hypothetical protein